MAIRNGETPVPIPNTTVKTDTAESTLLETAREDRWLPHQKGNNIERCFTYIHKHIENRISKDLILKYLDLGKESRHREYLIVKNQRRTTGLMSNAIGMRHA